MTAVLQFEIDKKRLDGFEKFEGRTPLQYIFMLARKALLDTFDNGGTFVMVVSAEKITIVQRKEAADIDDMKKTPE